ncbi:MULTISPECIES: DUF5317 family protein [unclassified Aeromicrobium]|uniref:DUF5317 family protein n=1 Tax=unclassified Aeromicrobium TaxID=2633570 RepID=UPI00396B45EA
MPSSGEWLIIAVVATISLLLLVIGRSRGWRTLFPTDLRLAALIPAALAISAVADHLIRTGTHETMASRAKGGAVLTLALVLLWANRIRVRNRWTAVALVATVVGVSFNSFATLVRGGMPVVAVAAREVGLDATDLRPGYVWADPGSLVDWVFGDSIPMELIGAVVSVGDVLLLIGFGPLLVWFLVGVFAPPSSTSPSRPSLRGEMT